MSDNALYTDLSGYYDLMCADINYQAQSNSAHRFHQIFGNGGKRHLDLACGTGPHIQHFQYEGYECSGLDINQPMLDLALQRCPDGLFTLGNMCDYTTAEPYDLITCFLYSIHYSGDLKSLKNCIESTHKALKTGGVFCFNSVDKNHIDNNLSTKHSVDYENSVFSFGSSWFYRGEGEKQTLKLSIDKTTLDQTQQWTDEHPMVALSFTELQNILAPYFDVHVFEHEHDKIAAWDQLSGNAIFVCIKKENAN
ncbi:MAG: class I SAM-dependent DNA methyltransferase [Marinomonas foliarum]|jgi:ubiquinone/menaquinone biosynthesis C-methylase UbiE|uniref:Class I SAM-dependent methyltransferase n=1 Tax=Marinomonas foliarum TaxID=491950 RepID=A0A368ZKL8_9GAMM|nr:class I SAM-dependent methyltransferase [Marinomonas foliarum]QRV24575.1 class I SAM-dependent methyltransferase [Marinomonas foliarum]RCW94654.1 ubiquinone/menaquinone biosynthesis C-methylase UbiE [Marinomonas foliarum]